MLNDKHHCQWQKNKSAQAYANNFEAKLARYVHQRNPKSQANDQKWALLVLKNDKLTGETRNAIKFQLTITASLRKMSPMPTTIEISIDEFDLLIEKLGHNGTMADTSKQREAHEIFTEIGRRRNDTGDISPAITFSEGINALKQVTTELEKCRT